MKVDILECGPRDGERLEIPDGSHYWTITIPPPTMWMMRSDDDLGPNMKTVTYAVCLRKNGTYALVHPDLVRHIYD